MAEIRDEVGPSECPRRVEGARTDMAGVGARGGIAARERGSSRRIADDAGGAAVADELEFPVPARPRRHPHLELHRGLGHANDAADRNWQRAERGRIGAGGPQLGERDRRVRNAHRCLEIGARDRFCRQYRSRCKRSGNQQKRLAKLHDSSLLPSWLVIVVVVVAVVVMMIVVAIQFFAQLPGGAVLRIAWQKNRACGGGLRDQAIGILLQQEALADLLSGDTRHQAVVALLAAVALLDRWARM